MGYIRIEEDRVALDGIFDIVDLRILEERLIANNTAPQTMDGPYFVGEVYDWYPEPFFPTCSGCGKALDGGSAYRIGMKRLL